MAKAQGPPYPADKDRTDAEEKARIARELREAERKFGPKPKD